MKAVILAGGEGKRLLPITKKIPKCLIKIERKVLIDRLIENIANFVSEIGIVVSRNKLGGMIIEHVLRKWKNIKFKFFYQEKPLGTGDALKVAKKFIENDLLVTYSDLLIEPQCLKKFINVAREERKNYILAVEVSNPKDYGCLEVKNGFLTKIWEKSKNPPSNLINGGVYYFNSPKIFEFLEKIKISPRGEYELTDALNMFCKVEKIHVFKIDEKKWIDVGTPERLKKAIKLVKTWK